MKLRLPGAPLGWQGDVTVIDPQDVFAFASAAEGTAMGKQAPVVSDVEMEETNDAWPVQTAPAAVFGWYSTFTIGSDAGVTYGVAEMTHIAMAEPVPPGAATQPPVAPRRGCIRG